MSSVNPRRDYQREHMRKWRAANPEKELASSRRQNIVQKQKRKLLSPEEREKANARTKIWYANNRTRSLEKSKEYRRLNKGKYTITNLMRNYKLSEEDAIRLHNQKQNGCGVCKRLDGRMHVDHNHTSGKVRGILCHRCNASLGFAADNPAVLRALAQYVEQDGTI